MSIKLDFGFDLFDSLPDMYFLLNIEGEIEEMNSQAREIIYNGKDLSTQNFIV
jgi:hypothetical protein